jgi:hypothetical protein
MERRKADLAQDRVCDLGDLDEHFHIYSAKHDGHCGVDSM